MVLSRCGVAGYKSEQAIFEVNEEDNAVTFMIHHILCKTE
jgi:hypothetical protein